MSIREEILGVLCSRPLGLSTRQLSIQTGHGRATLGKYLELLMLEGRVKRRVVGASKIWSIVESPGDKRILIVEDDPDYIRLLKIVLSPAGYEFFEVKNGERGLEVVREKKPDLIILDVMLPGMDGFEVCKDIKENALTRDIPVLMLTAKGELQDRFTGLKYGADDYVPKPFSIDDLRSRVESLLQLNDDRNPLTNLPGRKLTEAELQKVGEGHDVIVVSFRNIDSYKRNLKKRDYGECVRLVAQTITHELFKADDNGFLGHLDGDVFIILCRSEKAEYIVSQLKRDLSKVLPLLCGEDIEPLRVKAKIFKAGDFKLDDVVKAV